MMRANILILFLMLFGIGRLPAQQADGKALVEENCCCNGSCICDPIEYTARLKVEHCEKLENTEACQQCAQRELIRLITEIPMTKADLECPEAFSNIYIQFTVFKNGTTRDFHLIYPKENPECVKNYADKVFKKLKKTTWVPAKRSELCSGRPLEAYNSFYRVPIKICLK